MSELRRHLEEVRGSAVVGPDQGTEFVTDLREVVLVVSTTGLILLSSHMFANWDDLAPVWRLVCSLALSVLSALVAVSAGLIETGPDSTQR